MATWRYRTARKNRMACTAATKKWFEAGGLAEYLIEVFGEWVEATYDRNDAKNIMRELPDEADKYAEDVIDEIMERSPDDSERYMYDSLEWINKGFEREVLNPLIKKLGISVVRSSRNKSMKRDIRSDARRAMALRGTKAGDALAARVARAARRRVAQADGPGITLMITEIEHEIVGDEGETDLVEVDTSEEKEVFDPADYDDRQEMLDEIADAIEAAGAFEHGGRNVWRSADEYMDPRSGNVFMTTVAVNGATGDDLKYLQKQVR